MSEISWAPHLAIEACPVKIPANQTLNSYLNSDHTCLSKQHFTTRLQEPQPSSIFKILPHAYTETSSTICRLLPYSTLESELPSIEPLPKNPSLFSQAQLPHRKSSEVLPLPGEESRRIARVRPGTDIYRPP